MNLDRLDEFRNLSPGQKAAVSTSDSKIVNAGAGSGKTRVLTARYLQLLADGHNPQNIVAITFTKKAAREMVARISAYIQQLLVLTPEAQAVRRLQLISDTLPTANISTIHSFYTQILRRYPLEADTEPGFKVLDELEAELLLDKAAQTLYRQGMTEDCSHLGLLAEILGVKAVEENGSQLEVLKHIFKSLRNRGLSLEAVGLSGLYSELCDWGQLRDNFCDHVAKAAVVAAGLAADSIEYQHVRNLLLGLGSELATLKQPEELLPHFHSLVRILKTKPGRHKLQKAYVQLAQKSLAELLTSALAPLLGNAVLALLKKLEQHYNRLKVSRSALDFADLQFRVRELLTAFPSVVRELRARHTHFLIDEFQDTDCLQKEIIYLLTGASEALAPGALFVVGDEKQSIYRFRGADVGVFNQVRKDLTRDNPGREVSVAVNYRASATLINLVNSLFSDLMSGDDSGLKYVPMAAHRHYQSAPAEFLLCVQDDDESPAESEARHLAARIQTLVAEGIPPVDEPKKPIPVRYGDIAILVRSRTNLKEYEYQLRLSGIPYVVVGGIGFYQRQEVQDLLNLLKAVNNERDEIAQLSVLRSPLFALNDDSITALCANRAARGGLLAPVQVVPDMRQQQLLQRARGIIATLRDLSGRLSIGELLEEALLRCGFREIILSQPNGIQSLANTEKLLDLARDYEERGNHSLNDFLNWVQVVSKNSNEAEATLNFQNADAVRIMTIHASKGLEFPVVFVPTLSSSIRQSDSILVDSQGNLAFKQQWPCSVWDNICSQDIVLETEEQKRTLYVALTRAENFLVMLGRVPTPRDKNLFNLWLYDYVQRSSQVKVSQEQLQVRRNLPGMGVFPNPGLAPEPAKFPSLDAICANKGLRYYNISQFMLWQQDPDRFRRRYLGRVLDVESARARAQQVLEWEHEPGGPAFGSLLHHVLERLTTEDVNSLLAELIPRYYPQAPSRVHKAVSKSAQEILANLSIEDFDRQADESHWEQEFFYRHSDELFTGIIDRVYVYPQRVVIVDYKSNHIPDQGCEELVDYYRPQLAFYALAAESIYRRRVEAYLHFLRLPQDRQVQAVTLDDRVFVNLRLQLDAFINFCST